MVIIRRTTRLIASLLRPNKHILKKRYTEGSASISEDDNQEEEDEEEPFVLEDKTVLINGGATGIGLAIAKEFLKEGVQQLSIIDVDSEKGEQAQRDLSKEFGSEKVLYFDADVTDAKELDDAYRKCIQFHDIPEIVINSAGIMNDTQWEKQIKTNMAGCVIGSLLGLQYMSKASKGYGGIIVNIGSILGIIPSSGFPMHTMTQFGLCGFSKALGCGNHFARTGVKVLALCPGLTDTKLLADARKNAINDNFAQEFVEEMEGSTLQQTENVAKGLVKILDESKPGSVWVIENDGDPFEVAYPGNVLEIKKTVKEKDDDELATSARN